MYVVLQCGLMTADYKISLTLSFSATCKMGSSTSVEFNVRVNRARIVCLMLEIGASPQSCFRATSAACMQSHNSATSLNGCTDTCYHSSIHLAVKTVVQPFLAFNTLHKTQVATIFYVVIPFYGHEVSIIFMLKIKKSYSQFI